MVPDGFWFSPKAAYPQGMRDTPAFEDLVLLARKDSVQQLVVGGVVQVDGKILLLKRPPTDFMGGIYELPSGKVELGETLTEALAREVAEETGLSFTSITRYLGSFDYLSGSGKLSRQFNFVVSVAQCQPIRLTEHDGYIWSTPTDPPVTDSVREVLSRLAITSCDH